MPIKINIQAKAPASLVLVQDSASVLVSRHATSTDKRKSVLKEIHTMVKNAGYSATNYTYLLYVQKTSKSKGKRIQYEQIFREDFALIDPETTVYFDAQLSEEYASDESENNNNKKSKTKRKSKSQKKYKSKSKSTSTSDVASKAHKNASTTRTTKNKDKSARAKTRVSNKKRSKNSNDNDNEKDGSRNSSRKGRRGRAKHSKEKDKDKDDTQGVDPTQLENLKSLIYEELFHEKIVQKTPS